MSTLNSENGRLLTSVILQQVKELSVWWCMFGYIYFDHCTLNGHLSHTGYRCFLYHHIGTNNA